MRVEWRIVIEVKVATLDLLENIRDFYNLVIDDEEKNCGFIYSGWIRDSYPSYSYLKEAIEDGDIYVIEDGDEIISSASINHKANEAYKGFEWQRNLTDDQALFVHILAVHPKFQGQGYATKILDFAVDLARREGDGAIRLDVIDTNKPGQKLYRSYGFKFIDRVEMYYENTGINTFEVYEYLID